MSQKEVEPVVVPEETVQVAQHLVDQDWIAFEVPTRVEDPELELDMQLLDRFDRIDVLWEHPASGETDEHSLRQFQAGNTSAKYLISLRNGNILPGDNVYTVVGYQGDGGSTLQKEVEFDLEYDVLAVEDDRPELITFPGLPDEVDGDAVSFEGVLSQGVSSLQVTSYNPRSGKATFTLLNQYEKGETSFVYNAEERYNNLSSGDNVYVFEAFDEEDFLVSRKVVHVTSTKLTLSDEVKVLFGTFEKADGGWFVSSEKPWFSLRPAYESVYYEVTDQNVILPRPTLMYSAQADKATELCDYLAGVDYEAEGLVYKGYSYETCQQYGRGVSVYDRFLSVLRHNPVMTVARAQYQDLSQMVSSAFVMVETGGMPEAEVTGEAMAEEAPAEEVTAPPVAEEGAEEEAAREPRYYVYQMLITEDMEYPEKKVGDILEEMSEDRREEIETVRALLMSNSGDELFTDLLYPQQ